MTNRKKVEDSEIKESGGRIFAPEPQEQRSIRAQGVCKKQVGLWKAAPVNISPPNTTICVMSFAGCLTIWIDIVRRFRFPHQQFSKAKNEISLVPMNLVLGPWYRRRVKLPPEI